MIEIIGFLPEIIKCRQIIAILSSYVVPIYRLNERLQQAGLPNFICVR
jgi:hypothetical protein